MRKDYAMPAYAPHLAIIRVDDGWSLVSDDRTLGQFRYRVDAEEAALRPVERARLDHQEIQLLIQDEAGELRPFRA